MIQTINKGYFATLAHTQAYRKLYTNNLDYNRHLCRLYKRNFGLINRKDWFEHILDISLDDFDGFDKYSDEELINFHEKIRKIIYDGK